MKHMTPREASQLKVDQPDTILLDCREPMELSLASIAGATAIPMAEIPGQCEELPRDGAIIVFCHSGVRSQSVTQFLDQEGFENVYNMVGGIDAWSQEVDATIPRY